MWLSIVIIVADIRSKFYESFEKMQFKIPLFCVKIRYVVREEDQNQSSSRLWGQESLRFYIVFIVLNVPRPSSPCEIGLFGYFRGQRDNQNNRIWVFCPIFIQQWASLAFPIRLNMVYSVSRPHTLHIGVKFGGKKWIGCPS